MKLGNWDFNQSLLSGTKLSRCFCVKYSQVTVLGNSAYTRDALKKDSRGLLRVGAGNPWFPRLVPVISGRSKGASEKSGILCSWEGSLGTPLGSVQWKRASSRVEAGNSCFLSWLPLGQIWLGSQFRCRVRTGDSGLALCGGMELRLTLALFMGWQATYRFVCGTCGFFWTMHWGVTAPSCCAIKLIFTIKRLHCGASHTD